jgi:carbonic anhydrase
MTQLERKLAELEKARPPAPAQATAHHEPGDPRQEPQAALHLLVTGNAAYAGDRARIPELGASRRGELAKGQKPFAAFLSCADSRVPPEHIFGAGLGDVFVVRVAGNVADEMAIASTEYAVAHLGTRLIVVLAHSSCGAVKAACAQANDTPAVAALVGRIRPAVDSVAPGPEQAEQAAIANAKRQKAELLQQSTLLRQMAEHRQIRIVVARYRLHDGVVEWIDPDGLDAQTPAQAPILVPTTPRAAEKHNDTPHH